ncbi:hypothetical protein QAD02_023832, partial [Eretmocerus hayati]
EQQLPVPTVSSSSSSSCKLERKPSLRRKLGALIRGSADIPAAINRSLQPIRRSLSFSKGLDDHRRYQKPDLPPLPPTTSASQPQQQQQQQQQQHRKKLSIVKQPSRTRSVQWYSSLGSLAEIDDATTTTYSVESSGLLGDQIMHEENRP